MKKLSSGDIDWEPKLCWCGGPWGDCGSPSLAACAASAWRGRKPRMSPDAELHGPHADEIRRVRRAQDGPLRIHVKATLVPPKRLTDGDDDG